jgi:glycosyltransferase involved in cell wall biosynthesis
VKIAFVSHPGFGVLPPIGSVEIGTREMARRLAARHDVTIYGSATPATRDTTDSGIRYRFVDHGADPKLARVVRNLYRAVPGEDRGYFASALNPLEYWLKVSRELRREGYDVIHIANLTQALPWLRRFNPGARIVLHMHCEWLTQLNRGMLRRRLRHADAILSVSDYLTEPIRARFPDLADRCHTVYNGVAVDGAPVARVDDGTVRLLHVGRISPEKGHHVMIDALNAVVREHPEVRLTVVGEESMIPLEWLVGISADPQVRDLRRFYDSSYLDTVKRAMSPELAERVQFTGRVDHHEIARHYRSSDVLVFPSFFESMGMPPVEAMAAGLPVIATPVGGVVESVRDGETGVFVPRDDPASLARAIAELIETPERRAALGAAGHARALEHFSWDGVTAAFERTVLDLTPPTVLARAGEISVTA